MLILRIRRLINTLILLLLQLLLLHIDRLLLLELVLLLLHYRLQLCNLLVSQQ